MKKITIVLDKKITIVLDEKITIVLDEKDETIIFLCGLFLRNALTEWHPNTRRKLSPTSCA